MPEKHLTGDSAVFLGIVAISLLAGLGNALAEEECLTHTSWKHLAIQVFIAMIGGIIFGFFACWLIGNNWASFGISGAGAVLGIKGVRGIALIMMKKIEKNINKA